MPSLTANSEYTALAGVLAGSDAQRIVVSDGERAPRRIRIVGPWYYVRKCVRPLAAGPIILPDRDQDATSVHLVLAVGDRCGKLRHITKVEKRDSTWAYQRPEVCRPLDWVLVEDEHPTKRKRSPYGDEEWLVHEDIVLANLGPADPQIPERQSQPRAE